MNLKKLINIGIDRNELPSFISTLVATLVGVLIAIWLTDIGIKSKENEDKIHLLTLIFMSVHWVILRQFI